MQRADLKITPFPNQRRSVIAVKFPRKRLEARELAIELTRKSIHLLIAFVPLLLSLSKPLTVFLLGAGSAAYLLFEHLRMQGIRVFLISDLTARAARLRDAGRFVAGPITLGLGALAAILLFEPIPASIAVYILAFGDSFSSLVGKLIGRIKLPFTQGKSLEGSVTCFIMSLFSAYMVSRQLGPSILIALGSTVAEAIPTKDLDNIILPIVSGFLATLILA
ncbi:MAG: cdsA1 [Spirochaetes bacterium]|nr:MAG: cdsA1 [Spirochaetota bacterium]